MLETNEEPIFVAVYDQNIEQVTNLLEGGASVQTRHISGDFVIHTAARSGQVEMAQLLIQFGANVNEQDHYLNTPLHLAAQLMDTTLVQLLLDNRANPNAENAHGQTPLMAATFFNRYKVAQVLLKGGALVTEYSLCNRQSANHSIKLFRANIHIWATDLVNKNFGFRFVFLLGCSRLGTLLNMLRGKTDVLRVIGSFLGLEHWTAAKKIKTAVSRIESIEWENYDE